MIKVKQGNVQAGEVTYQTGSYISDLSAEDEARLIALGVCDAVVTAEQVATEAVAETSDVAAETETKSRAKRQKQDESTSEDGPATGMPV